MAGDTIITVVGNLTGDPELRFTPSGAAVANFTVASTPRTFDRQSNEWKDGETLFMRCSVWREAAENVAESLTKGNRVIVTGRLSSRRTRPRRARSAPWSSSRSTRSAPRCATPRPRSTAPSAPAVAAAGSPAAAAAAAVRRRRTTTRGPPPVRPASLRPPAAASSYDEPPF